MTDLAHGTVAVVRIDVKQNRDPARAVALQGELLVSGAGKLARAALDGPLDVIGGHILRLGRNDGATQTRVGVRIAAAIFRGDADFFDQTGENLPTLGVERALFMLDCGPL